MQHTVSEVYVSSFSWPSPMPRNARAGAADSSAAIEAMTPTASRLLVCCGSCNQIGGWIMVAWMR